MLAAEAEPPLMPELPHPDEVLGALARVIHVLRRRPRNTLDRLGAYEGLSADSNSKWSPRSEIPQ